MAAGPYIETRMLMAALLDDRLELKKLSGMLNLSEREALARACRMVNGTLLETTLPFEPVEET